MRRFTRPLPLSFYHPAALIVSVLLRPTQCAAVMGLLAVLVALPARGQAGPDAALFEAIAAGDVAAVEARLRAGADLEAPKDVSPGRPRMPMVLTPLSLAARERHLSVVQRLLEAGADASSPASMVPPLHFAAGEGDLEMTELLLRRGADVSATDRWKTAALHHAVESLSFERSGVEIVERLLEAGARVDVRDDKRRTPLLSTGLVLMWGVDPHQHAPLAAATRLLLAAGADPDARDLFGRTLLGYAASTGAEPLVQVLLEAGATPDPADQEGTTPLMAAAEQGHAAVARLLLEAGADPQAQGNWGSPLSLAREGAHEAVVKLLQEAGAGDAAAPAAEAGSRAGAGPETPSGCDYEVHADLKAALGIQHDAAAFWPWVHYVPADLTERIVLEGDRLTVPRGAVGWIDAVRRGDILFAPQGPSDRRFLRRVQQAIEETAEHIVFSTVEASLADMFCALDAEFAISFSVSTESKQ